MNADPAAKPAADPDAPAGPGGDRPDGGAADAAAAAFAGDVAEAGRQLGATAGAVDRLTGSAVDRLPAARSGVTAVLAGAEADAADPAAGMAAAFGRLPAGEMVAVLAAASAFAGLAAVSGYARRFDASLAGAGGAGPVTAGGDPPAAG